MVQNKNEYVRISSLFVFIPSIFLTKGQIVSECVYEIIGCPKLHRINLIDFCPGRFYGLGTCDLFWLFSRRLYSVKCITYLVWINFQGRNLSNLLGGILENWWFHKFWLHLTLKKNKHHRVYLLKKNLKINQERL